MENPNPNMNPQWQSYYQPPEPPKPWPPAPLAYTTGSKDISFAVILTLCSIALWNCILYGGLNLGAAIAMVLMIGCTAVYLRCSGCKADWYSGSMLILSVLAAAGFARSADGFVKFVMATFIFLFSNLSFCLMAGQNRRNSGGVTSLLDAPRALFMLGFGKMGKTGRGLARAAKNTGTAGKKGGALLLGLVIAAPVVAIMVFLLMRADAAFEGLMDHLPDADFSEVFPTLWLGIPCAVILCTRGIALAKEDKPAPVGIGYRRGWDKLTVNTILSAVCLVYAVYLFSQLAYFSGGFSGILPEDYTMAEYARRGFFEMAQLCAINLGIIWLACGLVRKNPKTPLLTRLLCLFIGIITIFFVATASAKMFMYIEGYGLTRLRVLTEVIMIYLGLVTALVCIWLFVPKMPYMKVAVILALVIGTAVLWVDVDTLVASYNVSAYQSGALNTVDVYYLSSLSDGAIPYLHQLTTDANSEVAATAKEMLAAYDACELDFRSWNWSAAEGWKILQQYLQQ